MIYLNKDKKNEQIIDDKSGKNIKIQKLKTNILKNNTLSNISKNIKNY